MSRRMLSTLALIALAAPAALRAQDSSMAGMPMDKSGSDAVTAGVNEQMNGMAMDSPHMRMTPLEPAQPGDSARADSVVRTLRKSLARYQDYQVALADGFQIFLPKVPQKVYHFTNYHSAVYAAFTFDAARPTSLLYEKTSSGYKLVGAMYTAPKGMSEKDLNARVPLSVAQWHVHVNICVPPRGQKGMWAKTENGKPLFGPKGTIATESACEAAGGRFIPQLFGWMVHVDPWATDPAMVWGTHEHEHEEGGH